VDIITADYIHRSELMKFFAVLDVSLTMGLTRCYKTEGFFTFIRTHSRTLLTLFHFTDFAWLSKLEMSVWDFCGPVYSAFYTSPLWKLRLPAVSVDC